MKPQYPTKVTAISANVHVAVNEKPSYMVIESTGSMLIRPAQDLSLFYSDPESIAKLIDTLIEAQRAMTNDG